MYRIVKQKLGIFERKLRDSKIETKNIPAIVFAFKLIIKSAKEKIEHFEQLNDLMPSNANEGIVVNSPDLYAVSVTKVRSFKERLTIDFIPSVLNSVGNRLIK